MNGHEKKERERSGSPLVVSALIAHNGKYLLARDGRFDFWHSPPAAYHEEEGIGNKLDY